MDLLNKLELKPTYEGKALNIVQYPSDRLTQKSAMVNTSIPNDSDLQQLLADMEETLKQYNAAGISAIQVGVPIRAIVVQGEDMNPIKMVNPTILMKNGVSFENEGCLSVPLLYFKVRRADKVTVGYLDENGAYHTKEVEGLLARAIQHEIDHLDGKVFLDHLSSIERKEKLRKLKITYRKFKLKR